MQWFLNFSVQQNPLKALLKHKILVSYLRFSRLEVGPRICISNRLPYHGDAACSGIILWKSLN